jgi:hypothetical protein
MVDVLVVDHLGEVGEFALQAELDTWPLSATSFMSTPRASALNCEGLAAIPLTCVWSVASEGHLI